MTSFRQDRTSHEAHIAALVLPTVDQILAVFDEMDDEATEFIPKLDLHTKLTEIAENCHVVAELAGLVLQLNSLIVEREDFETMVEEWLAELGAGPLEIQKLAAHDPQPVSVVVGPIQDAHGKDSNALAAFRAAKGVLADFKNPDRAVDILRATVTDGEVVSEDEFLSGSNESLSAAHKPELPASAEDEDSIKWPQTSEYLSSFPPSQNEGISHSAGTHSLALIAAIQAKFNGEERRGIEREG